MMMDRVLSQRRGDVALLTLNRPKRRMPGPAEAR
jgi:enoyl-CoA hydratase/carnithine racemase